MPIVRICQAPKIQNSQIFMRLRCAIDGFAATGCRNLNLKFLKIRFRFNLAIPAHMHTHQYTHPQLCLWPSAKHNKRAVQTATACGSWGGARLNGRYGWQSCVSSRTPRPLLVFFVFYSFILRFHRNASNNKDCVKNEA